MLSNLTDASNASRAYNFINGFNDSAAIVVYPDNQHLIIALLAIIAFCQLYFLFKHIYNYVISWVKV